MVRDSGSAGTAMLAHQQGDDTLVMDGETLKTQIGPQGFNMFVVRARVSGLAIEEGDMGAVYGSAIDAEGTTISLDLGCTDHEFLDAGDGWLQTKGPQVIAISPAYTQDLMGGMVRLDVTVRDRNGHSAATENIVKAEMP
jgi:hypothetical protein